MTNNISERAAGQEACREAEKLGRDKWKAYRRAYSKVWYYNHTQQAKENHSIWAKKNRDSLREYQRDWQRRNPERVKAINRRKAQRRKERELADLFKRCKQEGANNYGNCDSAGNAPV